MRRYTASLSALQRLLLEGGRTFSAFDAEPLAEDLQALVDLYALNINNSCGCQLPFESVEKAAAPLFAVIELFGLPVPKLISMYEVESLGANGPSAPSTAEGGGCFASPAAFSSASSVTAPNTNPPSVASVASTAAASTGAESTNPFSPNYHDGGHGGANPFANPFGEGTPCDDDRGESSPMGGLFSAPPSQPDSRREDSRRESVESAASGPANPFDKPFDGGGASAGGANPWSSPPPMPSPPPPMPSPPPSLLEGAPTPGASSAGFASPAELLSPQRAPSTAPRLEGGLPSPLHETIDAQRRPAVLLQVLSRRAEPEAREFLKQLQAAEKVAEAGGADGAAPRGRRLSLREAGVQLPPSKERPTLNLKGGKAILAKGFGSGVSVLSKLRSEGEKKVRQLKSATAPKPADGGSRARGMSAEEADSSMTSLRSEKL